MLSARLLQQHAASLLLYQSVLAGEVGQGFVHLLQTLTCKNSERLNCLYVYGGWFNALARRDQSWQDYLLTQIFTSDNPFTQQVQVNTLDKLPPALLAAAQQDLRVLQCLYQCSSEQLSHWVQKALQLSEAPIAWDREPEVGRQNAFEQQIRHKLQQLEDWGEAVELLASYYRQWGTGKFACYRALRWHSGELVGIAHPDPIQLEELAGYESQKAALIKNTEFLLARYTALHVLLYGSRGTGKSSLVKGVLNQYSDRGLRLVEVAKSQLQDLPDIVEQLRQVPLRFIIFVDDLSFEEDNDAFKALKVVLEGGVTARAQNVVIYATSNRRHLIREFFTDRPRPRDGDEVHAWDTMQEKLSFSDRFGLTLTFEPANQDTYLTIVRHLAQHARIALEPQELDYQALQWATRHNGRSGRTARQFIDFLQAELGMSGSSG